MTLPLQLTRLQLLTSNEGRKHGQKESCIHVHMCTYLWVIENLVYIVDRSIWKSTAFQQL